MMKKPIPSYPLSSAVHRDFLEAHVAAASKHMASLSIAEKQLMSRAYLRLKESKALARQLRFKLEEEESMPSVVVPGGAEVL